MLTPEMQAREMTQDGYTPITDLSFPKKDGSKKKTVLFGVAGVLVAGIVIGILAFIISGHSGTELLNPIGTGDKNNGGPSGPTVQNPLTGELVKEADAAAWKDERPIGVMINNYVDARPQSGLVDADLVYEVVAEGGITRFLAFFLDKLPDKIGPVRSTREYYLVLVKELSDAMIMHIGYSPQALEAIETWPVRSLSRGGATFTRDQARIDRGIAIEHTAYVNGPDLRTRGNELGWGGKGAISVWQFKNDGPVDTAQAPLVGESKNIKIVFWVDGDYTTEFKWIRNTNSYVKFTGYDSAGAPIPTKDQETSKQVTVKNLIVQFVKEVSIANDPKNRLDYQLVGSGQAIVFEDGKAIKATWSKASRDERTKYFDSNGSEIVFNRGKIWVSIVPDRNIDQVTY
jgi:hypothetical protein